MARPRPITAGRARPTNLAVSMREAFIALNDVVLTRLAERGHGDVRAAHGAVFQHLDDTGTTVSELAKRAQITKQAMAELVGYLEARGYVLREPDPHDGRAKLVRPTQRGRDVVAIAQDLVPQLEDQITKVLGADRVEALRAYLDTIREIAIAYGRELPLPSAVEGPRLNSDDAGQLASHGAGRRTDQKTVSR